MTTFDILFEHETILSNLYWYFLCDICMIHDTIYCFKLICIVCPMYHFVFDCAFFGNNITWWVVVLYQVYLVYCYSFNKSGPLMLFNLPGKEFFPIFLNRYRAQTASTKISSRIWSIFSWTVFAVSNLRHHLQKSLSTNNDDCKY